MFPERGMKMSYCNSENCPKYKECKNAVIYARGVVSISNLFQDSVDYCNSKRLRFYEPINNRRLFMFHATNKDSVESILKNGLQSESAIYFSKKSKSWKNLHSESVVLKVDLTGFLLTSVGDKDLDEYMIWTHYVEPERIKILQNK
jgi:hypothetical protein